MKQIISRDKELITHANIHLVAVDKNGKPTKIPKEINLVLEKNI